MKRLSWTVLLGLAVAVTGQSVAGCEPEQTELNPELQADVLLRNVGPGVVLPALHRFDEALHDLALAVEVWSDGAGEEAAARQDARTAFLVAAETWQELEVMQVGPAASSISDPNGQDLRDAIYSWPVSSPCGVDEETVGAAWTEPDFFDVTLVHVTGLDAVEHLLYAESDHVCPAQIGLDDDWQGLGAAGVAARRAAYADALVGQLQGLTTSLITAWEPSEGDFADALAAGDASPYGSELSALNAVYDAMFYLETVAKDRKLAEPLGLGSCTVACGALAEAAESGQAVPWLAANLRGFRALYTGGEGRGFHDVLIDAGRPDVAERMLGNIDDALELAQSKGKPLDDDLHVAVKRVTDDLKGDLATVLMLRLPLAAAGDND